MQRIIIAEESEELRKDLTSLLCERYQVVCCADGTVALELLRQGHGDVLVVDLMIPGLHAMSLIADVRNEQLAEGIIVTSRIFSDHILSELDRYSVDYAMRKPVPAESIAEQVEILCSRVAGSEVIPFDPKCAVCGMLHSLGFSQKRAGFNYSRDAILILAQEPDIQITKGLYPAVAAMNRTGNEAVERAIRVAIAMAWNHRDETVWRRYFSASPRGQLVRPANTEFLKVLAERIANRAKRYG